MTSPREPFLVPSELVASSRIALEDTVRNEVWSYAELRSSVVELVSGLPDRDGKALFFLFARNDPESIVAYLAVVESGHAVALLDPELDLGLKRNLVELYRPEYVVGRSSDQTEEALGGDYEQLPDLLNHYSVWAAEGADLTEPHAELSVLLSTSGTTGSPKLVRLSRRNVEANARSIAIALNIDPGERPITSLPPFYSYGLSVINSHLVAGASVILTDESVVGSEFWDVLRKHQCTSFAGVPYTYQILRRIGFSKMDLPTLHTLTQAGGKLEASIVAEFHEVMQARGGKFFVMYGQTEATARISVLPAEELPARLGSAGRALPDGRIAFDVDGELTSDPHRTGELVYWGPNVMMGYAIDRHELERADELEGRLQTGDLGHFDEDGFIFITGRNKRIAKLFGLRVNLDEIEQMLKPHGPAAVVGGEDQLHIFCEFGDDAEFAELRTELAGRMRLNHRAFDFQRIDELPLTSNGKIDYGRLSG